MRQAPLNFSAERTPFAECVEKLGRSCLSSAGRAPEAAQPNGGELIRKAIEQVADPRQYRREPEKTDAVMAHLNAVMAADGLEVVEMGGKARLRPLGAASAAVAR